MIFNKTAFVLCLLLGLTVAQQICKEEDKDLLNYVKKGMTYQV